MRTADLVTANSELIESVIMTLSRMDVKTLKDVDQLELFERLARTLIASNTSDDIKEFLMHHVRIDLSNMVNNLFKGFEE